MARAGLFLTDLFGADGVTSSVSGETPEFPRGYLQTDLPGQMYQQWEGQEGGGSFELTSGTNDRIYINEGGGVITIDISGAAGWYGGPSGAINFAAAIQAELNTAANQSGAGLSDQYSIGYNATARKFSISNNALNAFTMPNASSPAQNLMTLLLGFDATNVSGSFVYLADSERSSTQTWIQYVTPLGSEIAPNLIALILESVGGTDTAASALYNDVTIFASNSYFGNASAAWEAGASLTINVSDRPSEDENTLQAGVTSNATAYRYWFVRWNHVDDHAYHRIGICRAMAAISSSTRTVREISDQDLFVRTPARTLENQHPVQLKSEWRISIELERWEAADYRAWMVESKRYGRASGMVFSLNWTDVLSGTLQADDEADKGFLFYGTIRQFSSDAYSGNESDYMSGQMSLGQLRP
jgi:hypothetical protein